MYIDTSYLIFGTICACLGLILILICVAIVLASMIGYRMIRSYEKKLNKTVYILPKMTFKEWLAKYDSESNSWSLYPGCPSAYYNGLSSKEVWLAKFGIIGQVRYFIWYAQLKYYHK